MERRAIALARLASTGPEVACRVQIGGKSQPVEVIEQAGLEFGARSLAVVVLHAQEYLRAHACRQSPHVNGIDDVAQVERAGRRRRESRAPHDECCLQTRQASMNSVIATHAAMTASGQASSQGASAPTPVTTVSSTAVTRIGFSS